MQVYEEGTHFLIPWFERPIIYDVRTRPNTITSTSGSKDLQMVRPAAMLMTLVDVACKESSTANLGRTWC